MKRWSWSTGLAVAMASGMLICPTAPLMAAAVPTAPVRAVEAPHFALDAEHGLPGVVVDLAGQPKAGTLVDLHKNGITVAKTLTADDGSFRLDVPAEAVQGEYLLTVGPQTIPCRIWNDQTAPPTARKRAALAAGTPAPGQVVRGQHYDPNYCPPEYAGAPVAGGVPPALGLDFVTLFTLGAAGTAAVLSGINQSDINDIEDQLDRAISP